MAANNDRKNVLSSALDARKVLPFALLVLALVIALTVSSISRHSDLLRSQELVEKTYLVLHEIDRAEDSLQDAREAQLHYVLTPEQEDLVNFEGAAAETWTHLDRISQMTNADKNYPERIEQLRGFVKAEFQQARNNMRTTHTLLIFHSPEADANRDRVRAAMQKLKDDEEEVLRVRNDAARARSLRMEASVTLLIGGFSVLVAMLFLLVIFESRKLSSAEQYVPNPKSQLKGPSQQLQVESMATAGSNKSDSTNA